MTMSEKCLIVNVCLYSKTCVKRPIKIDKTKIFMTNGSLMKIESIADQVAIQHVWHSNAIFMKEYFANDTSEEKKSADDK